MFGNGTKSATAIAIKRRAPAPVNLIVGSSILVIVLDDFETRGIEPVRVLDFCLHLGRKRLGLKYSRGVDVVRRAVDGAMPEWLPYTTCPSR